MYTTLSFKPSVGIDLNCYTPTKFKFAVIGGNLVLGLEGTKNHFASVTINCSTKIYEWPF